MVMTIYSKETPLVKWHLKWCMKRKLTILHYIYHKILCIMWMFNNDSWYQTGNMHLPFCNLSMVHKHFTLIMFGFRPGRGISVFGIIIHDHHWTKVDMSQFFHNIIYVPVFQWNDKIIHKSHNFTTEKRAADESLDRSSTYLKYRFK